MDLFSLVASITLDSSAFVSGIGAARDVFGGFADIVTQGAQAAGRAAWGFMKDVVTTGMEVDKQYSAVQAVLGREEGTIENMNRLRGYGLEVARDSIFTAQEVGEAYYYMGMAGWKTEQQLAGLKGIINLAAAADEDLARTSDIVTDSITAFGLTADDVGRYADILAQTATNANTDVARMGQTFKYVAPVAGALGYDVGDVAVAIGILADNGIKGSMAGTALRNIFTRLSTDAGATANKLGALGEIQSRLGVEFYDAAGNARPWLEFLTDVRAAWADYSNEDRDAFYTLTKDENVKDAATAISNLTGSLDEWEETYNSISSATERRDFVAGLEQEFESMGVKIRDQNGNIMDFATAVETARGNLSGLTDAEAISIANRVGNLRSMAAWLALMNATDEEFEKLTSSIENAEGAAQTMADIRLDNLWGDVQMFNASLDVLKVAIFDDVKGPMREVVQYGTEALDRITDAINENGLTGGIEQLGTEIEAAGEKFQPMLRSIGAAAAPLVTGLIETVLPALSSSAIELGSAFGEGLFTGISNSLGGNGVMSLITGFLGESFGNLNHWVNTDMSQGAGSWTGVSLAPQAGEAATMTINDVEVSAADIQAAIDAAAGSSTVTIAGMEMDVSWAQDLLAELTPVGATAGPQIATDIGTSLSGVDASGLESNIAGAGPGAGASIVSAIASALSGGNFHINVAANVTGLPEGTTGTEKHAKSMFGGHILRGATVFGLNASGQPLVGGEAGPEAVVGLGSLQSMIHQYVGEAFDRANDTPVNIESALRDSVAGGLRDYGPTLADEIGAAVGAIVASAIARVASRPVVTTIDGKAMSRQQADYNAIAANARNKSIARGYGAGK